VTATTTENRKWQYKRFGHKSCYFKLSMIVTITWLHFYQVRHVRRSRICPCNFDAVCHISRDISISGFDGHFRLSVIIGIAQRHSVRARRDQKPWVCRWNFDDICHTFEYMSTSGFGSHIVISGCRSFSKLLTLRLPWSTPPGSQLKREKFDVFLSKRWEGVLYPKRTRCG